MKKSAHILKLILFTFTPLIVLCVFVEYAFYVATGDQYYEWNLWNTISYLSKSNEPERDLAKWEDNTMTIRNNEMNAKAALWATKLGIDFDQKKGDTISLMPENNKEIVISPKDLKDNGKNRTFIVGCSSAYGYGVLFTQTFGYLLEKYSTERMKVINAGQVGWSSTQLVPVVKRILESYKPHTIILYMSNNEWKNWSDKTPSIEQVAFWQFANFCTHSYALSYIFYKTLMRSGDPSVHKALYLASSYQAHNAEHFKEYTYALNNPVKKYDRDFNYNVWTQSKAKYLTTFRNNLLRMVDDCKKHGVLPILLTLPINYKLSPSWSFPQPLYTQGKTKDQVLLIEREADALILKKQFNAADSLLNIALGLDPKICVLHYMKAVALENKGQFLAARESYSLSREYMVGDLGSVLSINKCIAEVAVTTNTPLLDVKKQFDDFELTKGHYYNEDLIDDDCHPNVLGHRLIAKSLIGFFNEQNSNRSRN